MSEKIYIGEGLVFVYSKIGEPVITRKDRVEMGWLDSRASIHPRELTVSQLRLAADFIENNQDKTLAMNDGSGRIDINGNSKED